MQHWVIISRKNLYLHAMKAIEDSEKSQYQYKELGFVVQAILPQG